MKRLTSWTLVLTVLFASQHLHAAQGTVVDRSSGYWYAYASKLPIGATVRVRTTDGKRHTATLAVVDPESITLELKTRIPEPARRVPYSEILQLELKKNGSPIARSVAIGAGVGAGFFLVMLGIFAASWD